MDRWSQNRNYNYGNRRKRKINYKRLLLSLAFLCIISLMPMVYSSFFAIKDIQIRGNIKISTEEILAAINNLYDTNLLAVNADQVKHALQATIPIKDVNVRYKLPHTLIVEVEEREVAAALNYLTGFALIDTQGITVELVTRLETYAVPVLTGLKVVDAKVAAKPVFEENAMHFEVLLKLIDTAKPILHEISEINLVVDANDDPSFYLYTLDGYQVFLGELDNKKIITMQQLLADIRDRNLGKGLLDISHNTPIFKPFSNSNQQERR
ncbi:MAG: FtsQ-type POTRA domain-containing protein [Thermoanaerobacteraceae bacterium]|nr:FtsQ-type POTRA domain-containing protein [Thermoanaerobacteraceae bacterium]